MDISADIIIRSELPEDYFAAELIAKRAFWNLHFPGCNEHYFLHRLRSEENYISELSRVAEYNGKVIGGIYYSRCSVRDESGRDTEVLTFGPLCVDPDYQKMGVGGRLLRETTELARRLGHRAIIIFGEPDYYPRFGFCTCDRFGITTEDGHNFDAFMGFELVPGAFDGISGRFIEIELCRNLPQIEVDEYDKLFPYMEKLVLPRQWDV